MPGAKQAREPGPGAARHTVVEAALPMLVALPEWAGVSAVRTAWGAQKAWQDTLVVVATQLGRRPGRLQACLQVEAFDRPLEGAVEQASAKRPEVGSSQAEVAPLWPNSFPSIRGSLLRRPGVLLLCETHPEWTRAAVVGEAKSEDWRHRSSLPLDKPATHGR